MNLLAGKKSREKVGIPQKVSRRFATQNFQKRRKIFLFQITNLSVNYHIFSKTASSHPNESQRRVSNKFSSCAFLRCILLIPPGDGKRKLRRNEPQQMFILITDSSRVSSNSRMGKRKAFKTDYYSNQARNQTTKCFALFLSFFQRKQTTTLLKRR